MSVEKPTSDKALDLLLNDLRRESTSGADVLGLKNLLLVDALERARVAIILLKGERDTESLRFVHHLDAWRRNIAYHAREIERLQAHCREQQERIAALQVEMDARA